MSIVQSSFASALPVRTRARRMVVVSFGEAERLTTLITAKLGGRVEVVHSIRVDDHLLEEQLPTLLSPEVLRRDCVSGVVIVNGDEEKLPALVLHCERNGIRWIHERAFLEKELGFIDTSSPEYLPAYCLPRHRSLEEMRKRVFDFTLALAALILGLPLMAFVALLVYLDSDGPVIYRQERVGLRGRVFTLYKFRSMRQNAEADGSPRWATIGDPRITRVGRFIRYTRIDELPQLLNVLHGDMSIIGPRPERPYFVKQLEAAIPAYSLRHSVRPGITGWAQVKASYGASIEDARVKLGYDMYYLKHRGLILDFLILMRTLRVIILQEGAR